MFEADDYIYPKHLTLYWDKEYGCFVDEGGYEILNARAYIPEWAMTLAKMQIGGDNYFCFPVNRDMLVEIYWPDE